MKTNQNLRRLGFTLIELLVVVLIIGILTSVALPQYNKAVLKSRFVGVISNVESINRSLELYYLENGSYPTSLKDIDISISGCNQGDTYISCPDATYQYWNWTSSDGKNENFFSGFLNNKLGLAYIHWTEHQTFLRNRANQKHCWADSNNQTAIQVCQGMQGIPDGTENWQSQYSNSGLWNKYKLP